MPRSAIIWTRSRELSLKARYHLTHRMMVSWSKCRPLNRSCAEVGSVIPAVIGADLARRPGYRAFQQFAPEPNPGVLDFLISSCGTYRNLLGPAHFEELQKIDFSTPVDSETLLR